jgi:hypothetical protein
MLPWDESYQPTYDRETRMAGVRVGKATSEQGGLQVGLNFTVNSTRQAVCIQ